MHLTRIIHIILILAVAGFVQAAPDITGAEPAGVPDARDLSRTQDDRRPDVQFSTTLFGRRLTIGGEYGFVPLYRRNFAFGRSGDDLFRVDQNVELEFLYDWSENVDVFLEAKYRFDKDMYVEGRPEETDSSLRRGETWIYVSNVHSRQWGVQLGRQNIREKREWWWDEDLDAARLHFDEGPFRAELALAEELGSVSAGDDIDPETDDIFRVLARGTWKWARKQRLEAFFIDQNDNSGTPVVGQVVAVSLEDEEDADLTWFGLRALGRIKHRPTGRYDYWVDTGYVSGSKTTIDFDPAGPGLVMVDTVTLEKVQGWAVDAGVTWTPKDESRARWTVGFARGSGDGNPGDGTDHAYHQTGLQDNNGKFRGVDRFRYYGELFRPELSNLDIYTVSIGFPILGSSSVEIPLHVYRQVKPSTTLRNSRLRTSPNGASRDIGTAIDVIVGLEEWKHLELELVVGLLRAGKAFGGDSGNVAATGIFKLNYNF